MISEDVQVEKFTTILLFIYIVRAWLYCREILKTMAKFKLMLMYFYIKST